MTITMSSPAKDWILEAKSNDPEAFLDKIKHLLNCDEADVDEDGDIWIAGPSTGHWLKGEDLEMVGNALKRGDI